MRSSGEQSSGAGRLSGVGAYGALRSNAPGCAGDLTRASIWTADEPMCGTRRVRLAADAEHERSCHEQAERSDRHGTDHEGLVQARVVEHLVGAD